MTESNLLDRYHFLRLIMIISGKFHVDPENMTPWVEWCRKVIQSVTNPNDDLKLRNYHVTYWQWQQFHLQSYLLNSLHHKQMLLLMCSFQSDSLSVQVMIPAPMQYLSMGFTTSVARGSLQVLLGIKPFPMPLNIAMPITWYFCEELIPTDEMGLAIE